MGESLFDLIKNRNLVAYADPQIREHVTNATGIETARGYRLAKEKASKKIDLAVWRWRWRAALRCRRVSR
jgi:hypothetical protein